MDCVYDLPDMLTPEDALEHRAQLSGEFPESGAIAKFEEDRRIGPAEG